MCFIRKGLELLFSMHDLRWLDDIMPESHKREKDDKDNENKEVEMMTEQKTHLLETGGTLEVPLADGQVVSIPASEVKYRPKDGVFNLSDEVGQTAIWKQLTANALQDQAKKRDNGKSHRRHHK